MSTREEPDGDAGRGPRGEAPADVEGGPAAAAPASVPAPDATEPSVPEPTANDPSGEPAGGAGAASPQAATDPASADQDPTAPTAPAPSDGAHEPDGPTSSDEDPDDPAAPVDPMTAEEIAVDRSRVRRAPRYGRFIWMGVALGLLVSLAQTIGAEPEDIAAASGPWTSTTVGFFLIMAAIFVPAGVLLGALTALVLDRRSRGRRPRRKDR